MTLQAIATLIGENKLVIGDGYRAKNDELAADGLPFARAQNINDGFKFDRADRFPIEQLARVGNKVSAPGDVVFTSKGTVGRFALVSPDTPRFVYSPQLCFWRSLDPDTIDPRWLFYWMQGREFYEQYKGVAGQTDMADYVSLRDQRAMSISLPKVDNQRSAAKMLGSLDDKIGLNRRVSEILEAIAQALFQSWFVDFDPVRAKASGEAHESTCQRLGLTPELLALFPDQLVESELGEIPVGWSVRMLGDVIDIFDSKRIPLSSREREQRRGTYPYIGAAAVMDHVDDYLFDGVFVLMGEDGSVTNLDGTPILQYVWGKFWVNNHAHVLQAKLPISNEHLLLFLRQANIASLVTGAVQAKLSQGNMKRISFVQAPDAINRAFGELIAPSFGAIRLLSEESRTLAETRNSLLPKLLTESLLVAAEAQHDSH